MFVVLDASNKHISSENTQVLDGVSLLGRRFFVDETLFLVTVSPNLSKPFFVDQACDAASECSGFRDPQDRGQGAKDQNACWDANAQ